MKRGFSTIELLIAMAIAILVMTAVLMTIGTDQMAVTDSELNAVALHRAQDIVESAAAKARTNYSGVAEFTAPFTYGGVAYSEALTTPTAFQTQCSKTIVGTVSWTGTYNRNLSVTAESTVVDVPEVYRLGGSCSPTLPGDWDNPSTFGSADLSPAGVKGMSVDVAVVGTTKYAFLGTKHSSPSKDDFWVIDVSNPSSPVLGPHINTGNGINDLDVVSTAAGTFAYVVEDNSVDQFQTIDVSVPSSPVVTSVISLDAYGVDSGGTSPEGRTIHYYNGRIYIGLFSTIGPELLVFDVATDPANPSYVGDIGLAFNHNIYDIVVKGNYAYLATSYDSREIMIIDISGTTPVDTTQGFNTNFSAVGEEDATALYLVGSRLYVGLERASNATESDLYVLDLTTPLSITEAGKKRIGINPTTRITGVSVAGPFAFLSTDSSTGGFQVWRVDVPSNINQPFSCMTYNYSEKANHLIYSDNLVFIANESNDALRIIQDQPSSC